jgi:hypothetical protein
MSRRGEWTAVMGMTGGGPSSFPDRIPVGSRIAGYRVESKIGQGGMAVVFRAQDERLQRQVALKILSPELAADDKFRRRFVRECRSAAAVEDPHIIPVFEAGDANGVLYIAMRYVSGGDVATLMRRLGPFPSARAAAIVSSMGSALDAAHAAGLVHRDIKPANMLVDTRPGRADHVYLSDFGLTKSSSSLTSLTSTGYFLGTLDYCAPEQIRGEPVDARTDEYALACVAFALLAGEPPFRRDEAMAVMYAQLSVPPPQLTSMRRDLPPEVDGVLQRALAKAPDERYPSCGEFADALGAALGLRRDDPGAADPGAADPGAAAVRLAEPIEPVQRAPAGPHARPGPDDPDPSRSWFGVADQLAARGDHAGAEREFRHALPKLRRSLGPDHPATLTAWFGIARELAARGDHAGAEKEFRYMLPYLRRKLGPDHPSTLTVNKWIDYIEAEKDGRPSVPRPRG